jgi:hypothetical protein
MGVVIRFTNRRQQEIPRPPQPTRRAERRYRYPGPELRSEISCESKDDNVMPRKAAQVRLKADLHLSPY